MSTAEGDPPEDLNEIDWSSVTEFMERHNLGRIEVTIEKVDLQLDHRLPDTTLVGILERPSEMQEDEVPSASGTYGVLVLMELAGDGDG